MGPHTTQAGQLTPWPAGLVCQLRSVHAHTMAEVEVESPAAAPEAVEEQPAAATSTEQELPTYDPAKLIMVKGKVKKPVKPDDTERNVTLEKLSAEIKRCTERIAEIKALREQRRSRGVNPEAAEHKKRKEGLSAEWNAVLVRVAGSMQSCGGCMHDHPQGTEVTCACARLHAPCRSKRCTFARSSSVPTRSAR